MRMLSKIVLAAVAVSASVPVFAEAPAKERFVHEGYTYVYKVKQVNNAKVISGTRYPGAVAFNLKVAGDTVKGVSGGQQIAFRLADAAGATTEAE